jgi:hypothetical protein
MMQASIAHLPERKERTMYEDEDDVQGHGTEAQHNETVVEDDVQGHGIEAQHNETVDEDEDDVQGHGTEVQHNETVVEDDEGRSGS